MMVANGTHTGTPYMSSLQAQASPPEFTSVVPTLLLVPVHLLAFKRRNGELNPLIVLYG